jgi:hypothetical protein
MTYKTFLRSCNNWKEFSSARKMTVDTGLAYDEARRACARYNDNRNTRQINRGTKMEFQGE